MSVDAIPALVAYLKADSGVLAITTRVFAPRLPISEAANMPRQCVVLRRAGGLGFAGARDFTRLQELRIDAFCYGANEKEAGTLNLAVHDALLRNLDREKVGSVLLHSATQSAGPADLMDPDGNWPLVLETFNVIAAEQTAA